MKEIIIFILFICGFATWGRSQQTGILNDTTALFYLDSNSTEPYDISKHVKVFEDSSRALTIEEVSSPSSANRFHKNKFERNIVQDQSMVAWAHFRVINRSGSAQKIILSYYFVSQETDYYRRLNSHQFEEQTMGVIIPLSKRKSMYGFVTTIEKNDTGIFYIRFTNDNYYLELPEVNLEIYTFPALEKWQNEVRAKWWFNGIYSGITFLMAIYALALFFVFRERAYLWLICTQVINLAYFLHSSQVSFFILFPEYVLLNKHGNTVLSSLIILSNFFFLAEYLQFKKYFPRLYKGVFVFVIMQALITYTFAFLFHLLPLGSVVANYMIIPIVLSTFGMMLYQAIKLKQRTAGIMVWADVSMFFTAILTVLVLNNVINIPKKYIFYILQAGFIMQMLIWTVAIIDKVILLRKQKDQSQERELEMARANEQLIVDQNNILEQKVNERSKELQDTQGQLVQQEKLASLGALTAGIAHEIKNPLNFVNNFAEISKELIDELHEAKTAEEREAIFKDIKSNLEKITHHGKRADSIVKSMLEHSRNTGNEKQLTDINRLCEEFANLAYHGMRAGMPDFNCEIKKEFAAELPEINLVPQDISRVLLNLFNNAFYATLQKKKSITQATSPDGETGYQPTITIVTMKESNAVIIKVKDNGNGIPSKIKTKIFEPFFTTKPSGEGTGLGLSLSYDIITKHGGELKMESEENEYTEFTITLPI